MGLGASLIGPVLVALGAELVSPGAWQRHCHDFAGRVDGKYGGYSAGRVDSHARGAVLVYPCRAGKSDHRYRCVAAGAE